MLKKFASILIVLTFLSMTLTACQPSVAMIEAEKAFYQAQIEISKNRSGVNPVLLEIKASNPGEDMIFQNVASITVFAPPPSEAKEGPVQYKQVDYSAPWAPVALSGLGIAGAVTGNVLLLREAGKYFTGGTNYNNLGDNSSIKIQGGTAANINQSGGTLGTVGPTDATSVPTVVEQPAPIIVNQPEPVVVNPVVVQ